MTSVLSAGIDLLEPAVARFSRQRRWIAVEIEGEDLAFHRSRGASTVFFGNGAILDARQRRRLVKDAAEVELRLRAERVIFATLKVPAGGLAYVEQIVDNRLDRLTPWKPEKVLYGFSSAAKTGADGQVDIDFAATSQEIAAASIARLESFGLVPSRLGAASEPIGQPLRIDLFRGRNDRIRRIRRRRIGAGLLTMLSVCLVAFLATSFMALQSAQGLGAIDENLAAVRRRLVQGGATGDRQRDLALIAARTPDEARFVLIDRLAAIIPQDTFLDELDIQKDRLRLAGTSSEASALIAILEAEPMMSDASFAAPVTRQEDGRDRFDITASRVAPIPGAAP